MRLSVFFISNESHSLIIFFVFIILALLSLFTWYSSNTFLLLTTSELFWITLYSSSLLASTILNLPTILALSLYFLMFSASEISIGILIFIVQISYQKSISLISKTN